MVLRTFSDIIIDGSFHLREAPLHVTSRCCEKRKMSGLSSVTLLAVCFKHQNDLTEEDFIDLILL